MIQASTMMWMDLSLNGSGCHWGIYSRDGNFLRSFPRLTDHMVMASANRLVCLLLFCTPFITQCAQHTCSTVLHCLCASRRRPSGAQAEQLLQH